MPNRKRNQPGIFSYGTQGYTQPMRSRGEAIYGSEYDDGDNYDGDSYHSPRRPVATPYVGSNDQEWRRTPYNEQDRQARESNYGVGGYYGGTYNQDQGNNWNRGHADRERGRNDGWRSSDERYEEGRWREFDRGPASRSDGRDDGRNDWNEGRSGSGWPLSRSTYESDSRESWNSNEGQHRGKGPRGYQRSDDRVRDDINDRLADDPFLDATDIEVLVLNGDVTLSGAIHHRSDKRRAEDICERVSGVKNVENRLRLKETFGDMNRDKSTGEGADSKESTRRRATGSEAGRSFT